MDQTIKIKAEVDKQDINICHFTVDRPVYEGSAVFNSKEDAANVEIAKRLFNIAQVAKVELNNDVVTLTKKDGGEDWRGLGKWVGFYIRNTLQPIDPSTTKQIKQKVEKIIEAEINPMVASHGGYIELVDVVENNVFIKMSGGCQGCSSSSATLKMGIEKSIRDQVPEVFQILDVTDHAAGQNPYYSGY
ncbi:MAG: NifU family protein [Blastocatellia bacterium]|nr:NifU family protein [Blastocatellia bacterium]